VDLYAERHAVRETVRKNLYTGKTLNSVENIRQFFAERATAAPPPQAVSAPAPTAPPGRTKKLGRGSAIEHPKFGRGTIVMMEGSGEDTKITVSFPGHGLKKMVAKYAGIKLE
jgi:DNA helicase-2/ATP-dependent DNA helicase PcrA